jgi:hypothetical protein
LLWGSDSYTAKGPFAFFTFKVPTTADSDLQMLAAHVQLDQNPNSPGRFVFWDKDNKVGISTSSIVSRINRSVPAALPSFRKAVAELEDWLTQFKREQLERFPALEGVAGQLVAAMLND